MAKVTQQIVINSGIDFPKLLELLVSNAAAELTTYYYYTVLLANLVGIQGATVKDFAEVARIEDKNHYEALVPRIYELGGKLPNNLVAFHDISSCPPAFLPKSPMNITEILTVLVNAERCAVYGYNNICNMTYGKDHRTYDLALSILNEEIIHESWFAALLGEGPSANFKRSGETSPFVSKFLK